MKRYEHVAFPEVLDISRYVYPKTDRVKTLLTPGVGLCDSRPASRRLVGGNHCTAATPSKRLVKHDGPCSGPSITIMSI